MDDLLTEFVAETREMLGALSSEVVAWEADPADRARLDTIFRFVHTVKGNCGFFDFPRLEALSHAAEDALADVRAGRRSANRRLVDAVLAVLDRIGAMIEDIERGQDHSEGGDEALIAALAVGAAEIETVAPAPVEAATINAAAPTAEQRTIRLPVELIDQVMSGVSEMVLARNDLSRRMQSMGGDTGLEAPFSRLSALLSEVRDAITRTRMRRIDGLFATFPRLVRDLSAELGKQVFIELENGEVELDREMIELIRDPLLHIIRNAVDHGIERPADRRAAGKREAGMLTVSARQSGNTIHIGIMDDGRGIDVDRLSAKAVAAGLRSAEQIASMSREQKIELIFEPGLTTAEAVTAISGRGVGMDVVRANIEKFGGTLEIESSPGEGTRFLIRVPLTLSILPSITVEAGGQTFALPRSYVEEIVSAAGGALEFAQVGERRFVSFRGRRIACVSLSETFGFVGAVEEPSLFVILRLGWGDLYALAVDRIFDHQELVIKPLSPGIMQSGLFVGCTQLDDGTPVLVLDVAAIGYGAGVPRELHRPDTATMTVPAVEREELRVVLLRGVDGERRAIAMKAVEQVERVAATAVRRPGADAQVVLGEDILPLAGIAAGTPLPDRITVLRLCDGDSRIAYAALEILEIAALSGGLARVESRPDLAGIALIEGEAFEVIDCHALFARHAYLVTGVGLSCRLEGDDGWMQNFLGPIIEAAGYRIVSGGQPADIAFITSEHPGAQPTAVPENTRRAIRLTDHPGPAGQDGIYRYDRAALMAALLRAGEELAA
ncbi:MAG TPA: chemotaxis protein CheA [Croceibacterium sp.]|nr:chemotaxis protein CheA [Croceibacterium sp.]